MDDKLSASRVTLLLGGPLGFWGASGRVKRAGQQRGSSPQLGSSEATSGVPCSILAQQVKKDKELQEKGPAEATRMTQGLEHLSDEERLRDIGVLKCVSLKKKKKNQQKCKYSESTQ